MSAPGPKGYDADPAALAQRYERVRPEDKLRPALHLLHDPPARVAGITWTWLAFRAPAGFLRQ